MEIYRKTAIVFGETAVTADTQKDLLTISDEDSYLSVHLENLSDMIAALINLNQIVKQDARLVEQYSRNKELPMDPEFAVKSSDYRHPDWRTVNELMQMLASYDIVTGTVQIDNALHEMNLLPAAENVNGEDQYDKQHVLKPLVTYFNAQKRKAK